MNVWYILYKMKETISNQRSLAHTDQALSMFPVHFTEAVKEMEGGGDITVLNLNTIKNYYCCDILIY
jgi:hypothetical protein